MGGGLPGPKKRAISQKKKNWSIKIMGKFELLHRSSEEAANKNIFRKSGTKE